MAEPQRDDASAQAEHDALQVQRRADAVANQERILRAALALSGDRRMTMTELAAAAGVGRSTLYRHFPTKESLAEAVGDFARREAHGDPPQPSNSVAGLPHLAPGQLGRDRPVALEVTHILDEVPPHLIADQLVAEARRAAGAAVALYVVDIDGSQLVRLAGSEDFPERLDAPPALGPEIVPEGLPEFSERLRLKLPRCHVEPLWLRGRVTGLLLCVGAPLQSLEDIAKQGAAALEIANDYTDLIEVARRRKPTTPAAEIQHNLLPPRITRVTGAQLAGGLLPSYEVGGDWFDYVENRDGVWLAIADAEGTGPTAASLSATALGALRAVRLAGGDLIAAAKEMHDVVGGLGRPDVEITTILARWHGPTSTLAWINCGHPIGHIADVEGELRPLEGPVHPALGAADFTPDFEPGVTQLASGERVILVTKGITERTVEGGGTFGVAGIRDAVRGVREPTAPATAMAIQRAVVDSWQRPLEDDAALVVLAVD